MKTTMKMIVGVDIDYTQFLELSANKPVLMAHTLRDEQYLEVFAQLREKYTVAQLETLLKHDETNMKQRETKHETTLKQREMNVKQRETALKQDDANHTIDTLRNMIEMYQAEFNRIMNNYHASIKRLDTNKKYVVVKIAKSTCTPILNTNNKDEAITVVKRLRKSGIPDIAYGCYNRHEKRNIHI